MQRVAPLGKGPASSTQTRPATHPHGSEKLVLAVRRAPRRWDGNWEHWWGGSRGIRERFSAGPWCKRKKKNREKKTNASAEDRETPSSSWPGWEGVLRIQPLQAALLPGGSHPSAQVLLHGTGVTQPGLLPAPCLQPPGTQGEEGRVPQAPRPGRAGEAVNFEQPALRSGPTPRRNGSSRGWDAAGRAAPARGSEPRVGGQRVRAAPCPAPRLAPCAPYSPRPPPRLTPPCRGVLIRNQDLSALPPPGVTGAGSSRAHSQGTGTGRSSSTPRLCPRGHVALRSARGGSRRDNASIYFGWKGGQISNRHETRRSQTRS